MRMMGLLAIVSVSGVARADEARPQEPSEASPWYGSASLGASLAPFGAGTEWDRGCTALGAAECSGGFPVGPALAGYVGFRHETFGFEWFLASAAELYRPEAHFDGVVHEPFVNPLYAAPARDETFIIVRSGFVTGPRLRYTTSGNTWRGSVAAGVGLAYRYLALVREATSTEGQEDRPYFSKGTGYFSPALTLDTALHIRATSTLAVALGIAWNMETAWDDARSRLDDGRRLAGNGAEFPIATPPYRMASGLQFTFSPYVGLVFGR